MRLPGVALSLALAFVSPLAAAETASRQGWTLHPSFDILASVDDLNQAVPDVLPGLAEPSPTMRLASAVDIAWEGKRGRVQTSALVLTRSPYSEADRSYFAAGRLHAVRSLGSAFRLALDDSARWQRDELPSVTDFQRNEAVGSLEWRPPGGVGLGLRLSDRRRSLPHLHELGFSRQSAGLAVRVDLGQRVVAEAGAAWQRYSARTADGQRLSYSIELARFGARGAASARFSWFEPRPPRALVTSGWPRPPAPEPPPLYEPAGGVGARNNLVEDLALGAASVLDASGGVDNDLSSDPVLFDPLESESDEWDFGRRKQVLVGFVSRRLGETWLVSAVARYQHKRGPDLLVGAGVGGPIVEDDRLAVRLNLRRRLTPHLALLVQGCHLQTWADRAALRFSRRTLAAGLELRY